MNRLPPLVVLRSDKAILKVMTVVSWWAVMVVRERGLYFLMKKECIGTSSCPAFFILGRNTSR